MDPGSVVLEVLLVAAGAGAPLVSVPWVVADLVAWDMMKGFKNVCEKRAKGGKMSWGLKLVQRLQNIHVGLVLWDRGLNVRDGTGWASHFKWLQSLKNQWIQGYSLLDPWDGEGTQLMLYPFYLGSYLLEYSCAGMAGSCWSHLTSALTFIPWQAEYRGTRRTIETRRHQTLPVPKPQGHRIAQKALPAAPVSILLSMKSPDHGTFPLSRCSML